MTFCDKCKGGIDPRFIHVCLPMPVLNVEDRIREAVMREREDCARIVESSIHPNTILHAEFRLWLAHKIRTHE